MTTAEVASQLTSLCREGKFLDAVDTLYADDVVSVEPADYAGLGQEVRGKAAVRRKNVVWLEDSDVHSGTVSDPFVGLGKFAVVFSFDWTKKSTGEHMKLTEVGVYAVENGKITREDFLYGA